MTTDDLTKLLQEISNLQEDVSEALKLRKSMENDLDKNENDEKKTTRKKADKFLTKLKLKLNDIHNSIDKYNNNKNNKEMRNNGQDEEKPSNIVGKIKIKDINTLLDPNLLNNAKKANNVDDAIVLSDSEEETTTNKKPSRNSRRNSVEDKPAKSQSRSKELRTRTKNKNKTKFDALRKKRLTNCKVDISTDSSSDECLDNLRNQSKMKTDDKEIPKVATNDKKFLWKTYVSLPLYPTEELKKRYLDNLEISDINRLTDLKSLKRKRRDSHSSSSSSKLKSNKTKSSKKGKPKKTSSSSSSSSSSELNDNKSSAEVKAQEDELEKAPTPVKETKEDERQIMLLETAISEGESSAKQSSDEEENPKAKESEEAAKKSDEDKNKEDKANSDKESSGDEPNDTQNDKPNSSDSSKSDEEENIDKSHTENKVDDNKNDSSSSSSSSKSDKSDEESKKEKKDDEDSSSSSKKNNWRKDKLLTDKMDMSDSDENFEKYCEKKKKLDEKNDDEEFVIPKKIPSAKSPKKKKRKVICSDSDSDSEVTKNQKSSSSKSSSSSSSEKESSADENKKKEQKKKPRRRVKKMDDSSDEDDGDGKSTRKQIRKVWNKDSLSESTIQAEKEERERKDRIAERQKKYNDIFEKDKLANDKVENLVLDFDEKTKKELLSVHEGIVKNLKPHQAKGVQFMFDACFESLEHSKSNSGSGCILAHCMGLGKTLQVIALCHTLLANSDKTKVNKVLVVCPLSTVLNWVAEFEKWLPKNHEIDVHDLINYKKMVERNYKLQEWMNDGGVMVMGYNMFRNLTNATNKRINKKFRNTFQRSLLDPGPDLVICDEGHLLKNEKSSLSIAMNKIKTLKRIVLTGTPLQNNLKEYYCMVQFVRPNLLGTYKEYMNRFVNPITNGQYTDSTPHDISIMRRRSHVLHKMLDGIVQRKDYSVLAPFLPPKQEYVLFIKLTDVQIQLYDYYLREKSMKNTVSRAAGLFNDFQEFQRICTHPRVLLDKSIEVKIARDKRDWSDEEESEGSLKNFINDDSDDENTPSTSSNSNSDEESAPKPKRVTRANADLIAENEAEIAANTREDPSEWWRQFVSDDILNSIKNSSKLILLFEILQQCELIGDKLLIFSQSLYSLNVIEYFLNKIDEATQNKTSENLDGYVGSWSAGLDYFRLDGSTSCDNRALWCKLFNDPNNMRARLFLISTRAGGLGINLVAANRVIIFDVSWNPSHDVQSIYRVYRFGQTKPCYIYRFVTLGTMEMKVYERQVTKQAISKRVIDEQQIDRHYNQHDLLELYKFEPDPSNRPVPLLPKDVMLAEMLQNNKDIIYKYHEHQTLLENKEEEELNEEERKAAWEEYENEKKVQGRNPGANSSIFTSYFGDIPYQIIMLALKNIILRSNPSINTTDITKMLQQAYVMLVSQIANNDLTFYRTILNEIQRIQTNQYQMQQQMRFNQPQRFVNPQMYNENTFNNRMPNPMNPMFLQNPFNNMRMGSSSRMNNYRESDPLEIIELTDEP